MDQLSEKKSKTISLLVKHYDKKKTWYDNVVNEWLKVKDYSKSTLRYGNHKQILNIHIFDLMDFVCKTEE